MNYYLVLPSILKMNKLALILVALLLSACDKILLGEDEELISLEENLRTPTQLQDGWNVSSLEQENIKGPLIRKIVEQFHKEPRKIHSLLIIKNNKLVLESYFGGWHGKRFQSLRSASKSVTSALVGIAIDKNYIKDVDQKLFDFFPEYSDLNTPAKNKIKLKHVLSMTTGLSWDQTTYPFEESGNDEGELYRSPDGFRYVLQKEVVADTGIQFNYNSGNSDLLTGIIHHTTGIHADIFAEEHLFKPLGIIEYGWRKDNNLFPNGGWGLHLFPRDMAKIGQLFLDKGKWKGRQVISEEWVKLSTTAFTNLPYDQGYGFQWWTQNWLINGNTIKTFQAQGNGGQVICVIPEFNAVVVFTGGNYDSHDSQLPYNLLKGYILPALQ